MQRNLKGFVLAPTLFPFFHFFSPKEASILHLYSSVYSILFRAGLRREGLRSAQRHDIIPPISSPLCVRISEKEIITRLPCVGSTQKIARTNASHKSTCINSLHTFLSSTQILRSAMMFLYLLVSVSLSGLRTACLFWRREGTQKSQLLKNIAL